ncbi:ThiF family adenylyltransferase [Radicibacter daui]|uniref:ThiF family adenylyltransferase n=1 Tax=Radicibacter daui TaxID=3064829 RepID=UPI004046C13D
MSRYARQLSLAEVGPAGQVKLAGARVLVVGAGGLGATLLPLLAGAGVGHLRIIDPDRVEESNLHRQTLYRMSDIGRAKAEVAAATLAALNPDCTISALVARLDPALARAELPQADIVVDAADMFAVTYALSDLCEALLKPFVTASVIGFTGYAGGFCGGAPGYRSVFPDLPASLHSCATAGVMGPAVATLGALQAQMVLAILLGQQPGPLGQMVTIDLKNWRLSGFRFDGAQPPDRPGPAVVALEDIGESDTVIELRGEEEAPGLPHPRARRLPPEALDGFQPEPGRRTVFVCASGLRAWRAAQRLQARQGGPVAILALPQ